MKQLKSLVILIALFAAACGGSGGVTVRDVAATRALFEEQKCSICHGAKGEGGVGPTLKTGLPMGRTVEELTTRISNGSGVMPAFKDKLSQEQISELAKFVYKEIQGR